MGTTSGDALAFPELPICSLQPSELVKHCLFPLDLNELFILVQPQ